MRQYMRSIVPCLAPLFLGPGIGAAGMGLYGFLCGIVWAVLARQPGSVLTVTAYCTVVGVMAGALMGVCVSVDQAQTAHWLTTRNADRARAADLTSCGANGAAPLAHAAPGLRRRTGLPAAAPADPDAASGVEHRSKPSILGEQPSRN